MDDGPEEIFGIDELVGSVIFGTNADLIAAAARLYIRADDVVLDPTYGKGAFWRKYRPEHLITHDLILDGVDCRHLPEADHSIDVVVFDPPYTSTGNRETSTLGPAWWDAYGLGGFKGWRQCFDLMADGMKEATRVLGPSRVLMVKCADYVESGRRRWLHSHVIASGNDLGLTRVDELILVRRHPGPQPKRERQMHSRQMHSFLVVFRTGN